MSWKPTLTLEDAQAGRVPDHETDWPALHRASALAAEECKARRAETIGRFRRAEARDWGSRARGL